MITSIPIVPQPLDGIARGTAGGHPRCESLATTFGVTLAIEFVDGSPTYAMSTGNVTTRGEDSAPIGTLVSPKIR
jgi:hypothetical protein